MNLSVFPDFNEYLVSVHNEGRERASAVLQHIVNGRVKISDIPDYDFKKYVLECLVELRAEYEGKVDRGDVDDEDGILEFKRKLPPTLDDDDLSP